jgi:hypothetical protein
MTHGTIFLALRADWLAPELKSESAEALKFNDEKGG